MDGPHLEPAGWDAAPSVSGAWSQEDRPWGSDGKLTSGVTSYMSTMGSAIGTGRTRE